MGPQRGARWHGLFARVVIVESGFVLCSLSFPGIFNMRLKGCKLQPQLGDRVPSQQSQASEGFVLESTGFSQSFPPSPSVPFLASVSEDCSLAVLDSSLSEV